MAASLRRSAGIEYWLEHKAVKNLNLRVHPDGRVHLSVPRRTSAARADAFVAEKAEWILQAQAQLAQKQTDTSPLPTKEEALALFIRVSEQYFPLFAGVLDGQRPLIKVRNMTTRWGSCAPAKRQITFSLQLAAKPLPLVEYVVLHEYCHFIHPNHQAGFWALMEQLMPDCRQRRKALRG